MRKLSVLVAAIVAATNSGAQVPLTIDPAFQFYYTADLMDYWSATYGGGGGMWQPFVSDVVLRNNGQILVTGGQLHPIIEIPFSPKSLLLHGYGDGEVVEFMPYAIGLLIPLPISNQYFSNRRRNYDLTIDFSFGSSGLPTSYVSHHGWHVFEDRSALAAGFFRIRPGEPDDKVLIRVDQWGAWDSTFTPRAAAHPLGPIGERLVQLRNGQFLFNGNWTHYDGRPTGTIIRINADGSQDTTFQTIAWSSEMAAMHEQPDGKVVLGGQFRLAGIPDTLNLIRLNTDGSLDYTFNNFNRVRINAPAPFNAMFSGINVLEPLDAGRFFIGGTFERVNNEMRGCMACVDTAGNLLDCWAGGGLHPMNYTNSGGANMWLYGMKTLANGETYIYGCYKGITDANGYHPEQVCMSRFFMPDVGLSEKPMRVQALAVWPNPGGDVLHVNWSGNTIQELELHDATGRVILNRTSVFNNNPIDVSSLSPGTYTVLARTAQGERAVAKWVKR
ncbi:MAG: T9SS type A sorting domain-containing protein [Flavobacteriales bacterium]